MEPGRNRVGIGLSCRPARLHRLAESIHGIDSWASQKFKRTGSGWTRKDWMIYTVEDQAFLRSYDSAPRPSPPPPPLPSAKWCLFLSLPVCRRSSLLTGEGGGGGRGDESYNRKKPWCLVLHHSILSGYDGNKKNCTISCKNYDIAYEAALTLTLGFEPGSALNEIRNESQECWWDMMSLQCKKKQSNKAT